jgi:hypothetical protein
MLKLAFLSSSVFYRTKARFPLEIMDYDYFQKFTEWYQADFCFVKFS